MEETKVYDKEEFQRAYIADTLKEVASTLEERGYQPENQIVGYLMSGDPGYISNHKEARKKLTKIGRTQLLELLVSEFLEK